MRGGGGAGRGEERGGGEVLLLLVLVWLSLGRPRGLGLSPRKDDLSEWVRVRFGVWVFFRSVGTREVCVFSGAVLFMRLLFVGTTPMTHATGKV